MIQACASGLIALTYRMLYNSERNIGINQGIGIMDENEKIENLNEEKNEEQKLTTKDFIYGPGGFKKKDDPYNLNTPFGSLEKNPFKPKRELEMPWDQTSNDRTDPFSGNSKKCPGCGANLVFDIEIGSLICRTCGNLYDPDSMEMNGSLGIETPEQEYGIDDELDYEDKSNKEIVCNSCGSQIVTDANTASTICPFCGSPALITRRLTRQFRPDAILPFSVTKEQAKEAYYKHVTSVPRVPKSFTKSATLEKITGVYVPFWLLSTDVKMDVGGWTHTVIDGSSFYDPLKQEATHKHAIDIPIDGTVEFSLKNVPFDGSRKISNRLMQACEPFDFSELVPYNASYLTGVFAEKYDCQPKDMYDYIRKRLDNYCHNVAEKVKFEDCDSFTYNSSYTGIQYKNFRVLYCLLPIWFLNVKYDDRNFQFAINGQTGEVCGVVPAGRGWSFMKNMSERITNTTYSFNRKVRALSYALPSVILALLYASLRSRYTFSRHGVSIFVALIILYLVSLMILLGIPPLMKAHEKKIEARMGSRDPHSLDRAPDVSFYLDTSRKIKATKKITKGGEFGIINGSAAISNGGGGRRTAYSDPASWY